MTSPNGSTHGNGSSYRPSRDNYRWIQKYEIPPLPWCIQASMEFSHDFFVSCGSLAGNRAYIIRHATVPGCQCQLPASGTLGFLSWVHLNWLCIPIPFINTDPKVNMSASEIQTLKHQLSITPKTATLLIKAGYADYRNLATVSPEYIVKQFTKQLRVPAKQATAYKRALRRMVWLGTLENPEEHAKDCKNWSNKALMSRGVWCSNFDSLTGQEMAAKMKEEATKTNRKKGNQSDEN
jgi:hypothetical protein